MFYFLSKVLDLAFSPVCHALIYGALAMLFLRRGRARLGRALGVAAWVILYLPASGWVARWLMREVEAFDGPLYAAEKHYDAVVLLGGFSGRNEVGAVELTEGADRLLAAWRLVRTGAADKVVIAGGAADGQEPEATIAADLLREAGIDDARILRDERSRNTRENALEVRDIVARAGLRKLALVTSAFHMQRALGCMRAVGLFPDALAVDRQRPLIHTWLDLLAPRADHLRLSEMALRELAGRLIYRARGYTAP